MTVTHQTVETRTHVHDPPEERFLHVVARDSQWILRGLCLVLLVATAVSMVTFFWFLAIPTSIGLGVCYVLLLAADRIEHQTDTRAPERIAADEAAAQAHSVEIAHSADVDVDGKARRDRIRFEAIERRLTRIGLEVLGGALVLATALGVAFVDWKILPIALLVMLVYIILVTTPVWLAWMEDDVHEVLESTRKS